VNRAVLIGMVMAAAAFAETESIVTKCLPDAVINKNYSVQLKATPGQTPVWSLAQGAPCAKAECSSSMVPFRAAAGIAPKAMQLLMRACAGAIPNGACAMSKRWKSSQAAPVFR